MSILTSPPSPDLAEDQVSNDDSDCNDTTEIDSQALTAPRTLAILVLSVLPFWAIPIAHMASNPETATGFFQYELPYYVANGRAAFERGDGLFYPNPYDPASNAPVIYAHWFPWILGACTAKLGCNAGDVILTATFFASLAFAFVTRQLVRLRLNPNHSCNRAFLFSMWGGGLLSVAGTIFWLTGDTDWLNTVLKLDPGRGMWFLTWGRNALFPTEAVYHTLVAGCWIAEIRRSNRLSNTCLLLLATTHPWSGLELLLTINLWRGIAWLRSRNVGKAIQLCFSGGLLMAFLGYYKVWLPRFPAHAQLQNVWELDWSLSWLSAALAYTPVLISAVWLVRKRMQTAGTERTEQFLLCALFVGTGLAFHDRIINPVQPLHFTRGYVWMPLFLLGLPTLLQAWNDLRRRSVMTAITACLILATLLADNIAFATVHVFRQLTKQDGFHLSLNDRALCSTIHGSNVLRGKTVLSDSETLNYLLPTYTNARPWLGHHFNTPDFPHRKQVWTSCFPGAAVHAEHIPLDVDVVVISKSRNDSELNQSPDWSRMPIANPGWLAWVRNDRE